MEVYNSRSEVPDKYKWDLTDFYTSDEELAKEFENINSLVDKLPSFKGTLKDGNKLLECLQMFMEAERITENVYVYTYLVNDQELGNSKSMQNKAKAEIIAAKLGANMSYFDPEILALTNDEYEKLFVDVPVLNEYKAMLDRTYRAKEHILSESEERIITELESAANHYDDMSSTMLNSCHDYGTVVIDGKETKITSTNYRNLMKNEDRNLRKEIREKYASALEKYGATSAQLLSSYVGLNETEAKIRKFNSAWDAKMFSQNMDEQVYHTLVDVVENHTSSVQKYYQTFKEELGLDELHQYDTSLDMSKLSKKYTIEEGQELILNALKPLGEDYLSHYRKVFDNHYIDYCSYKGKCSGGYSFSTMDHDSRILLSFNGDLEDISTIAHEGGHNVHHQYVKGNNPLEYRDISSLVCEVASLTNECLLSSYLAENGETIEERLAGIDNILGVIISNLFGAVREGKIEEDMYKEYVENGSVTKDFMDKEVVDSLKKYYGDVLVLDNLSNVSWMRRSHYYMDFYLYSYSICISAASYVAKHILSGDKDMLDKYIDFLKTGGDVWPVDVFKKLGIDLREKEVYEEAISYFDEMLNKYIDLSKNRR